jgi:hypothetical protein
MAPADILAVVEDQFFDLRKKLEMQLTRAGELQQQIDAQRKEMVELHRSNALTHRLLKRLVAQMP